MEKPVAPSREQRLEDALRDAWKALMELLANVRGECPSCIHEDETDIGFLADQAIEKAAAALEAK